MTGRNSHRERSDSLEARETRDVETPRCPVCRSGRTRLLRSVNADEAAQHYVLREVERDRHDRLRAHIRMLWNGDTCDRRWCDECGCGFADPFVAGDARFYDLAYSRSGYPAAKWEFRRTRESLLAGRATSGTTPRKLLEIGAGDGGFVRMIAPEILPAEDIVCTEFSEFGRRTLLGLGAECHAVDLRDLARDPRMRGVFDVVCMFQVLEHLGGLEELFEALAELVRPGKGRIYFAVPNSERIRWNEAQGLLLDMPPNHLTQWSAEGLAMLAERMGWKVVESGVSSDPRRERLREVLTYRYWRRAQDGASFANLVERRCVGVFRRILGSVVAAAYSLGGLRAVLCAMTGRMPGATLWVHLSREEP